MASKPKVILVKDKTVEKAIAEGLQILQAGRDEVEIEVLETGRRGFLGIGARKARVKLTLKERDKGTHLKKKTEVQAEEVKKDTYRDREIIAVEDDRIVLKQLYKNRYPVIRGDRDIRLFENGKLIQGSMVLTEESNIRYQLENKEARNEIIITISEDGLKAFLEIQRINGQLMEAIILPGAGDETDFIISTRVVREITPAEISLEDIYKELEKENIRYGIKEKEILNALNNPGSRYLIAEGSPMQEGSDARIEFLYEDKELKDELEDPENNIDYFSKNDILSVKKGEIVAIKHPRQEGKSGYNVHGEILEPPEYKDIEWRVGERIKIVDNKAVAIKSGRPVFEGGKFDISEILIINRDVDIHTGNISFNGDVVVIGNVHDNFKIESTGMIKISGNVTQAVLMAEGDIIFRGRIINSRVIAGGLATFYKESRGYMKSLKNLFEMMEAAIRQLKSQKAFKTDDLAKYGERQLIQLLLDTKFNNIINIIKNFYAFYENSEVNKEHVLPELRSLKEQLQDKIKASGLCAIQKSTEIVSLISFMTEVCDLLNKISDKYSNIWTSYIQKSYVKASGNVVTASEGAYNSEIYAGKKVVFKGEPGLCRGGR